MGSIETHNDNSVKAGGNIHTNMGSVNIKVDSLLVNVKGETNMGSRSLRVQHQNADWDRQELIVKSNMGNINVYDQD